jgi:hypothetical protein
MESPKHLSHKPIISVNNYDEIDASSANDTDAKALSIGRAQYDNNELSLKVWRHTEEKWSRQSEELPIHRNLDLSILFLAAISTEISAHYPKSNLREVIDNYSEVQFIKDYYEANKIYLEPRLIELKRIINNLHI